MEVPAYEHGVAQLRAGLGDARYEALRREGRVLSPEQLFAQIEQETPRGS